MDSTHRHWLHRALSVLWSAGHEVPRGLMAELKRVARGGTLADIWTTEKANATTAAMLAKVGFAADPAAVFPFLLPDVAGEFVSRPRAGHLVRLTGAWSILKPGDMLQLSGSRDLRTDRFRIGRGGHYWDGNDRAHVSLSAGGPSSIQDLPAAVLKRTNETGLANFWRFRGTPEAHTGVDYSRRMPVWEWSGEESDFV